jgi:hypothetical protein
MDEVQNQSVELETATEVASPVTEATQETAQIDDRQDRNWRELRRAKDDAERKLKMQDEMIARLMTPQAAPMQSPIEEDYLAELAQEEYVGGDKVAKSFKKMEERFQKKLQEVEAKYQQKEQNSLLASVKSEYADFDQVVNPETLDLIEETNPRLAASLARTMKEDPYSFAIQSYEYIKSRGLSKKAPAPKRQTEVEQKLEQNKKTVPSPQSFEKRPMARAFEMNDDYLKEVNREMNKYAQQAGMGY